MPQTVEQPDSPTLGLIAGGGDLPLLQARGMRAAGYRVACVGFVGSYDPALPELCDDFAEVGVAKLGKWAKRLNAFGATQAVMVGTVAKSNIYRPGRLLHFMPDWRSLKIWYREARHNKRSQFLLGVIARELQDAGVELIDTTQYIPDHLATPEVMTRTQPTPQQLRDIDFAWPLLLQLNKLDIGQALSVREQDVIALEAMEGTDRMIKRTAELCPRGGWVLIKGAGKDKDLRFDVPTIGLHTIESCQAAGAGCIALAAQRVIMVDKPEVIAAADKAGIALVGRAIG